jgi:hypothetical protein
MGRKRASSARLTLPCGGVYYSDLTQTGQVAEPGHSPCTQLANLCAYIARRWLQNPSAPQPYFDALRDGKVVQVIYPVQF